MRWYSIPPIAALALAFGARLALASCGCDFCPVDKEPPRHEAKLSFDLTQQYIDQDQPRFGTDDVAVGQVPSHHDEVRTVNRATTASLTVRPADAWAFSASLPYVSRYHEHIHDHLGNAEVLRWRYSGPGDLELLATRYLVAGAGGARYFLRAGVKAPTGDTTVEEVDGTQPEPTSRPGTGSWDLLAGLGAEWRVGAPGAGDGKTMPLRVSLAGRLPGRGTEDYRGGSELLAHAGAEYPVAGPAAALLQTNLRVRAKDDVGTTDEEAGDTGGTSLYLSPGARVTIAPRTSIYGLFQVPVLQRVNGIQLVAKSNLYVGISRGLF
jgi:hypothetical protein